VSTLRPVVRNVRAAEFIEDVAFAPDGGTLASVGYPRYAIRRFSARGLTPVGRRFVAATSEALSLVFAPDGRLLLCDDDGTVEVWDPAKPKRVGGLLSGCGQPGSLAVSPDGRTLAAGGTDVIALWDLSSGRQLGQRLVGHTGEITSLSFSADGRTLASAAGDMRLWDVRRRRQIGDAVPGYDFVAFTRDGLLSSGSAGTVVWAPLLFSESLETVRRRICSVVGRNLSPLEQREFLPDGSYEPTC
jgi:WD40 repeat protein